MKKFDGTPSLNPRMFSWLNPCVKLVRLQNARNSTDPRFVWIRLLRVNSVVFFDVLEGVGHQASMASMITLCPRTVDEILLTQRDELTSLSLHLAFYGSCLLEIGQNDDHVPVENILPVLAQHMFHSSLKLIALKVK